MKHFKSIIAKKIRALIERVGLQELQERLEYYEEYQEIMSSFISSSLVGTHLYGKDKCENRSAYQWQSGKDFARFVQSANSKQKNMLNTMFNEQFIWDVQTLVRKVKPEDWGDINEQLTRWVSKKHVRLSPLMLSIMSNRSGLAHSVLELTTNSAALSVYCSPKMVAGWFPKLEKQNTPVSALTMLVEYISKEVHYYHHSSDWDEVFNKLIGGLESITRQEYLFVSRQLELLNNCEKRFGESIKKLDSLFQAHVLDQKVLEPSVEEGVRKMSVKRI